MTNYLNKKEVAEKLSVSVRTVEKWVADRVIPFVKINRAIRFPEDKLQSFLDKKTINKAA